LIVSALEQYFNRVWYGKSWQKWLFWPASRLTGSVVQRKREQFLRHPPDALNVPIVIVGNLTVGGTGKTPLLLYLIEALQARGLRVGVISRGYGGRGPFPLWVTASTSASACGDEPAMIARRTQVPLVVDPDRQQAARYLLQQTNVDILLSDDGLQHYRLPRQLEIVVIDGQRGFGNAELLPMGPLREPLTRLESIPLAVINGSASADLNALLGAFPALKCSTMRIRPGTIRRLDGSEEAQPNRFKARPVTALAGIGNPERYFNTLKSLGISFKTAVFADHHRYSPADFLPYQQDTVIMTEKDAVKVPSDWLADGWYLAVDADITGTLVDDIIRALSL
jgi:tetraacyldisaccharide 4'-kinase